jgi:hypothetical protein
LPSLSLAYLHYLHISYSGQGFSFVDSAYATFLSDWVEINQIFEKREFKKIMGILMNCIKSCNSHLMTIILKNKLEQGTCEN